MANTNNTDGAALLPVTVTQADKDAAAEYMRLFPDLRLPEAFARHRQIHSLPGDVGMREALEEIADPIRAMRRNAEAQGRRLEGGVAYVLSNDPGYLKEIARKALAERPKIGHASGCVKINCAGCGSDFYSTDYGRVLPATQEDAERGGKDAVREAEAWLRAISDWLLANDHDMTLPSGVLDKDPLDIADSLATTPSAQERDR